MSFDTELAQMVSDVHSVLGSSITITNAAGAQSATYSACRAPRDTIGMDLGAGNVRMDQQEWVISRAEVTTALGANNLPQVGWRVLDTQGGSNAVPYIIDKVSLEVNGLQVRVRGSRKT
jgi:hypothetical protein